MNKILWCCAFFLGAFLLAHPLEASSKVEHEAAVFLPKPKPVIRFIRPGSSRTKVLKSRFKVEAKISNFTKKRKIKLKVNNRPMTYQFNDRSGKLTSYVRLKPGDNKILISAGKASKSVIVFYDGPDTKPNDKPNNRPNTKPNPKPEDKPEEDDLAVSRVRKSITEYSKQFVGVPYVYAGKTPKGFDCSGFTSYVMKHKNVMISPASREQAKLGKKIPVSKAKAGDLIFYDTSGKGVSHVSLVISNRNGKLMVIHATSSKGVMIQDVNASSYWKPKILFARDVISGR